jgi:hypothetical protein
MLTEKEIKVLEMRKKGLKQTEIAKKLGISQPAVSLFERNIRRKIEDSVDVLAAIKNAGVKYYKRRIKLKF